MEVKPSGSVTVSMFMAWKAFSAMAVTVYVCVPLAT